VHANNNNISTVVLAKCPEGLFGSHAWLQLSLDEPGRPRLGVSVDLGLILVFDVLLLEMKRQVIFLGVCDCAHVEHVLTGAEKTVHGYSEGQFRRFAAVNCNHVVVTPCGWDEGYYIAGLDHNCLVQI